MKLTARIAILLLCAAISNTAQAQTDATRASARPVLAVQAISPLAKLELRIEKMEAELKMLTARNAALNLTVDQLLAQKPLTEDRVAIFRIKASKPAGVSFTNRQKINHPYTNDNPKAYVMAMSDDKLITYRTEYSGGFWWIVSSNVEIDRTNLVQLKSCDSCGNQQYSVITGADFKFTGDERFTVLVFKSPDA